MVLAIQLVVAGSLVEYQVNQRPHVRVCGLSGRCAPLGREGGVRLEVLKLFACTEAAQCGSVP